MVSETRAPDSSVLAETFWRRLVAAALDYASVAALSLALLPAGGLASFLAAIIVFVAYPAIAEAFFGRTVWKALFGLRVATIDGGTISPTQALVRNVLRLVDVLPGFYGLGGLVVLTFGHGQRLGDLAARTVVVRR